MTASVRNSLLALAFSVLLLLAAGYAFLSVTLVSREGWSASIGQVTLLGLILETAIAVGAGVGGFVSVRRAYRKSAAPELFFFALFLAALAGESLLLLQAWLHFHDSPSWYSSLLTRAVWSCRFAGLFLLFAGSLFAFDFPYRKYGNLVVGCAALGIFLASTVPLQSTSARNHLLYAIGDAPGMVLFTALVAVVTAVNFLMGAGKTGIPERAGTRAVAALFFLGGWAAAIVVAPWGAVIAVPGIVLASWKPEQGSLR